MNESMDHRESARGVSPHGHAKRTPRKEAGWAIAAIGAAISVAVTLHPEKLNAPPWIAHLAAGAFVLGGLTVVFRSAGRSRIAQGLVCTLLAVFACIGLWIALGSGGECSGGLAGVVMAMLALAFRDLLRGPSPG